MDPHQIYHVILVIMSATIVMTTYPYLGITYKADEYGSHGKKRTLLNVALFVFIAMVYSQFVIIWIGQTPVIPADFLIMSVAFMFGPVVAVPVTVVMLLMTTLLVGADSFYALLAFSMIPLLLGTLMWLMSNKKCPGILPGTIMMLLSSFISVCLTYIIGGTPPYFADLAVAQIVVAVVPMILSLYFYHKFIIPEVVGDA